MVLVIITINISQYSFAVWHKMLSLNKFCIRRSHIRKNLVHDKKKMVGQFCPTLFNPMDCSPPGSSVHGILQARIPEWVAIPISRGVFPTQGLNPNLLQILYRLRHQGSLILLKYWINLKPLTSSIQSMFSLLVNIPEKQEEVLLSFVSHLFYYCLNW